jgi:UDP-N-acetylglucosamine-lysosomal-enzyme
MIIIIVLFLIFHRLSERFIYFNDDVFLGAPTWPEDFVLTSGNQRVYLSWDVPKCNEVRS